MPKEVLVYYHHEPTQKFLRTILTSRGYLVTLVENDEEVTKDLVDGTRTCNVILIGITKPFLKGLEIARNLQNGASRDIKRIFLSPCTSGELEKLPDTATLAVKTIIQPFEYEDLLNAVAEAVGNGEENNILCSR